jgi:Beta-propeller repeat/Abnormal spindle-like microcephaly-assoc'd, ASPM-SPD-2-Hydin
MVVRGCRKAVPLFGSWIGPILVEFSAAKEDPMKRAYLICLVQLLATTSLFCQSKSDSPIHPRGKVAPPVRASQADPKAQARTLEQYGKLPLSFEANQGQSDPQVKYFSRGAGYSLFLTANEAVLTLRQSAPSASSGQAKNGRQPAVSHPPSASAVLRMKLLDSNPKAEVSGQEELPGKSNYFIGNDPKQWHTNVRQFAKVRYENVYPGVDLVYYGHQGEMEYDFVLQPGANPQAIRLGIAGAKQLQLEHGDLVLRSAEGDVHLRSPHVYQEANGVQQEVRGGYVITSKNEVGFRVGAYDRRRALVIDPVLAYSTYLGGSYAYGAAGFGIAVDSTGNAYVIGTTDSADFPTVNPFQSKLLGSQNAFVTKFNGDGTALVYSTYLGGSNFDIGSGIAVDSSGNAYVTGSTESSDFPTKNAIQPTFHGGTDAFVTEINAEGNALVYSTYLGGSSSDEGNGIAVDSSGNAYIAGVTYSTDFPTTPGAFQTVCNGGSNCVGNGDAFVSKISPNGTAFVYSTYLGGSAQDGGDDIATDSAGNAYVTGSTLSADFPTAHAIQPTYSGQRMAFVTKFNPTGAALVYSTYLGGSGGDNGYGIAMDSAGNAYIAGATFSTDFPTTPGAFQTVCNGGSNCRSYGDAFVTKMNAAGSAFVYSTYLGGSSGDNAFRIAVDGSGDAYVTGSTGSSDFPLANAIQSTKNEAAAAFVTKFNADGNGLVYSTYLGGKSTRETQEVGYGIAADAAGSTYVSGLAWTKNFPTTLLGFQRSLKARNDAFVSKIAQQTFVTFSPAGLAFSKQVIGTTSKAQKVTVTNQGAGTLTINQIYIGGQDPNDFAETNDCGGSLAAGAKCTISVTFTPTAKNPRKAALGISDSDAASPQAIGLSGQGTVVSLSPNQLIFGNQPVGTTSAPQNVTLTNTGSTQLNFTGIAINGTNQADYSQTNTCGTSIAAKASCTITVTFTPTAIGTRIAKVSISDDGGGSPQTVSLKGTGT